MCAVLVAGVIVMTAVTIVVAPHQHVRAACQKAPLQLNKKKNNFRPRCFHSDQTWRRVSLAVFA